MWVYIEHLSSSVSTLRLLSLWHETQSICSGELSRVRVRRSAALLIGRLSLVSIFHRSPNFYFRSMRIGGRPSAVVHTPICTIFRLHRAYNYLPRSLCFCTGEIIPEYRINRNIFVTRNTFANKGAMPGLLRAALCRGRCSLGVSLGRWQHFIIVTTKLFALSHCRAAPFLINMRSERQQQLVTLGNNISCHFRTHNIQLVYHLQREFTIRAVHWCVRVRVRVCVCARIVCTRVLHNCNKELRLSTESVFEFFVESVSFINDNVIKL